MSAIIMTGKFEEFAKSVVVLNLSLANIVIISVFVEVSRDISLLFHFFP